MQDGGRCGDMAAVCKGSSGGMAAAGQEDDAQTPGGQLIQIRRDPVRQRQWSQVSGGSCCPGVPPSLWTMLTVLLLINHPYLYADV